MACTIHWFILGTVTKSPSSSKALQPFSFFKWNNHGQCVHRSSSLCPMPLDLQIQGFPPSLLPSTWYLHLPVLLQVTCGTGKVTSFVSSLLATKEDESTYITLSLCFIQDSHCCTQLHKYVFVSCFLMFLSSHIYRLPACPVSFLTQRGHRISPSLFFILIPDNSWSLFLSRKVGLLPSPSSPPLHILLLSPEPEGPLSC